MPEPDEVRTDRLVLRRIQGTDLEAFVTLSTAPETHPHEPRSSRQQAAEVFTRALHSWAVDGIGYWAIRLAGSEEVIGFGGVRQWSEAGESVFNLYYRFWPSAWGEGYAQEMARAALRWARHHDPDRPVVIMTGADNVPSVRLAERLGFHRHVERLRNGRSELVFRLPL